LRVVDQTGRRAASPHRLLERSSSADGIEDLERPGRPSVRIGPCARSAVSLDWHGLWFSWEQEDPMNFLIYMIGTLLVVGALAYGAALLGAPQVWIVVGAVMLIGIGLMAGVTRTRHKDPA
jgi:hypothetical protein